MIEKGPIIKYHNRAEDFSSYAEASFFARALAFFIDAAILGAFQAAFSALFDYFSAKAFMNYGFNIQENLIALRALYIFGNALLLPSLYYIPQIKRDGQTVGKKAMGIRIIRIANESEDDGGASLGIGRIFAREIIGKFISTLFFGAGFIVRLFGLDAFHDKMAKTTVISLKSIN